MQHTTALALLAGLATAYPQLSADLAKRQDGHPWAPAPAGAARAPCPGLNTMANHGFINNDGRGITLQAMQQGFLDAFGFSFDVTEAGGNNALGLCQSHFNNGQPCDSFDLDMLNVAHQIEHDASLTRNDAQMSWNTNADNHDFNRTVWEQTLCVYNGNLHITPSLANTARQVRISEAQMEDAPGWFQENDGGAGAEFGFTLTSMNDPLAAPVGSAQYPQARLDWVDFWFSNERLPTDLGWVKPSPISNDMVNSVAGQVFSASTVQVSCPATSTSTSSSSSTVASSSSSASATSSTASSSMPFSNGTTTSQTASTTPSSTITSLSSGTPSGSGPSKTSSVSSSASASASAAAPPVPKFPNGYEDKVPADQWTSLYNQCAERVAKYQEVYYQVLQQLGVQSSSQGPTDGKPSTSSSGGSSGGGSSGGSSGGSYGGSSGGSGGGYGSGSGAPGAPAPSIVYETITVTVAGSGSYCSAVY